MVDTKSLLIQIGGLFVVMAAPLFLAAGMLVWPAGWLFLGLFFAFVAFISRWLLRHDPDLLRERMSVGHRDQAAWDRAFIAAAYVGFLGWLALMALDAVRFRWSRLPVRAQAVGGAVLLASFRLFFLTYRANSYLSPVVRVQRDRGQTVVSTGPYRRIRHPMYAAFLLFAAGTTLLLGSRWGMVAGGLLGLMVARRAVLEERTLRDGLAGYAEYSARVRYRLVPGVW